MAAVSRFLRAFAADDRGTTAVEYGLIAALISLAIIGGVQMLGGSLGGAFLGLAAAFAG